MKISLSIKLGIFVLVLFALVIATCLLWRPVKVRSYVGKLRSDDPKERVAGVDGLLAVGEAGQRAIAEYYMCSEEEVSFLSKFWVKPNKNAIRGEHYIPPLHVAAARGYNEVLRLLLDRGVDVNSRCDADFTALHWAAETGGADVAAILIKRGANLNAITCMHETPLHLAAYHGENEVIGLLLMQKANANMINDGEATPLDCAGQYKHIETANLLRSHGAKTGEELRKEAKDKK